MAISVTPSPNPPVSLGTNTATFAGLAASTPYVVTIVGPQGTSTFHVVSTAGGAATVLWSADGGGTYTFFTALDTVGINVVAVPSGAFTVSSIN